MGIFFTPIIYTNFLHQNFCFFTPKFLLFLHQNFAFFYTNFMKKYYPKTIITNHRFSGRPNAIPDHQLLLWNKFFFHFYTNFFTPKFCFFTPKILLFLTPNFEIQKKFFWCKKSKKIGVKKVHSNNYYRPGQVLPGNK